MKPRPHAELIKAWADGAEIEMFNAYTAIWFDCDIEDVVKNPGNLFRIKQQPKLDIVRLFSFKSFLPQAKAELVESHTYGDLRLIFDGETGKLKAAEVIK